MKLLNVLDGTSKQINKSVEIYVMIDVYEAVFRSLPDCHEVEDWFHEDDRNTGNNNRDAG